METTQTDTDNHLALLSSITYNDAAPSLKTDIAYHNSTHIHTHTYCTYAAS